MSKYTDYQAQNLVPTSMDIEGPFYLPNAPTRQGLAASPTLVLQGQVLDTTSVPIQGAVLDFWQADEHGVYDEHGYGFRGKQIVNAQGGYRLDTVHPGPYKISNPGDPDQFRCSHIHVKVWINDKCVLTTQLYFDDDPYDVTDHWFSSDRCIKFRDDNTTYGQFSFVIAAK